MELASIGTTSHLEDVHALVSERLRAEGIRADVDAARFGALGCVRVRLDVVRCSTRRRLRCLRVIAQAMARAVIELWEPELLGHLLQRRYGMADGSERADVVAGARLHLERGPYGPALYRQARIAAVAAPLLEALVEHGGFHVDGMLTFRLGRYVGSLEEALGHAVDDHLLEREYAEFIRLLRCFVAAQSPRTDRVDLVIEGACFRLFDRDGQPMQVEAVPTLELESMEAAINYEDVLISALIAAAPTRIVVHALGPHSSQHVESVWRVFEARVEHCIRSRCGLCASA